MDDDAVNEGHGSLVSGALLREAMRHDAPQPRDVRREAEDHVVAEGAIETADRCVARWRLADQLCRHRVEVHRAADASSDSKDQARLRRSVVVEDAHRGIGSRQSDRRRTGKAHEECLSSPSPASRSPELGSA